MSPLMRCGCLALLVALPVSSSALPWNKDMVDQPSVKAQEKRVNEPRDAVPTTGGEPLGTPLTPTDVVAGRMQAAGIANPQAVTPESLGRGKALYEIHCLPCHGAEGHGDGPVGKKYTPTPMNLTVDYVQQQPDGQLYYTITHGGIVMPFYRDALAPVDRWNVVNYIKHALMHP